jgi:hypothetical protein
MGGKIHGRRCTQNYPQPEIREKSEKKSWLPARLRFPPRSNRHWHIRIHTLYASVAQKWFEPG